MRSSARTPAAYLASLPPERRRAMRAIREALMHGLPTGFSEQMGYGSLAWVVPLERYPAGYHCAAGQPLPFINLASQKQHIALYHLGLYEPTLRSWLESRWERHTRAPLDLATCCLRLRRLDDLPLALIGQLARKMTVAQWIRLYEASRQGR